MPTTKPSRSAPPEASAGVQALDTGLRLLSTLIELGPTPLLKTVAEHAGMAPPKAHRYLASFCRSGLVARDPASGGYRLGPLAVSLGLAALRQVDVVEIAAPALAALRDGTGHSVALAIWGTFGPTFVRVADTNEQVIVSVRPGSVMPVLSTATGRVFGAWLPRSVTEPFIKAELSGKSPVPLAKALVRTGAAPRLSQRDVAALFEQVRQHGLAQITGEFSPGVHGLSAPLFNHEGLLVGALSAVGGAGLFDGRLDGPVAQALRREAQGVSRLMGAA